MSFEPHFTHVRRTSLENKSFDDPMASAANLLAELDKIAPIKSFDAFPKVQPTYTTSSRRGGVLTAVLGAIMFLLVLNDLGEYFYGQPSYEFHVDQEIDRKDLQLNVDITVAMPCHYLSIDLRDVVGDRLHLSDDFAKDGTTFDTARTASSVSNTATAPSVQQVITDARRSSSSRYRQTSSISGLRALFTSPFSGSRKGPKQPAFRPTVNKLPAEGPDAGPACRMYGSVGVKKVTANLHVTTLGHGYMSWEHTDHKLMNLSHIIHEFSFGPYFPAIAQPLDMTHTIADSPFTIFQYFLSVVPTMYIDRSGRKVKTSQYAVTDSKREIHHGQGVPGIFFKYDLEALGMTIRERTTSLYQFLIRLAGVIGGVWTTASFALRVLTRAEKEVKTKLKVGSATDDPFAAGGGGIQGLLPSPGGARNGTGGRKYSPNGLLDAGYASRGVTPQIGRPGMMQRTSGSYF
ncbi:hypothetical protein NliqN6_1381 [Naganishia liquefaciens]|uniref:Endoplasmic reticulum-Golgi intermediate compartment protein 2 n=1 Tax=Naganishia liquefaciens TaxID=104408 RepID=A0A8H3TRL1_9TREE|nr:hypothetical protein NliqN6_1381 [Naganishia liquefaciens]